jgi:hypothetical protein
VIAWLRDAWNDVAYAERRLVELRTALPAPMSPRLAEGDRLEDWYAPMASATSAIVTTCSAPPASSSELNRGARGCLNGGRERSGGGESSEGGIRA